jgi:hypothetical protein
MPRKSTKVSKFKSEADEGDWYTTPEGRRQTQREFARALRAGTLSRSAGLRFARTDPALLQQLMERAKESATRAISIRVPIADLERARQIAEKAGVGYQTVLKQAIRAGLRKTG